MKRKLKIVNYSDIHEKWDVVDALPEGDILLFAGDHNACDPRDYDLQIKNVRTHLDKLLENSHKWDHIVIAFGNHDPAFDYSKYNHEGAAEIYHMCWGWEQEFNRNSKKARIYLSPGMSTHRIVGEDYELRILSSPYSKEFGRSDWGFWWTEELVEKYKRIKDNFENIDIVVSHESIYGYGDETTTGENVGTENILDIMKHHGSKPRLFVTGHIHEGYGVYNGKGEWEGSLFINASVLDEKYKHVNKPIEVSDFEVERVSKEK